MSAARNQIRRLEDNGVSVGERRRDLPGGNGDRKVPGRDNADDSDRLSRHLDVHIRTHGAEFLPGYPQNFAREEIEDLSGATDFPDGFGQGLAFFPRKQPSEFLLARENLGRDLEQKIVPFLRAVLDHAGNAACAAMTAASAWAASACAYSPTTSLVSEGLTLRETLAPSTHSPAM